MFIQAQRKFEISNAVLYLDPDKSSMTRACSRKFAMRGLGKEPSAFENLAFFFQKQLRFRTILINKIMLLKHGLLIGSANMIKLIAKMGHVGGG